MEDFVGKAPIHSHLLQSITHFSIEVAKDDLSEVLRKEVVPGQNCSECGQCLGHVCWRSPLVQIGGDAPDHIELLEALNDILVNALLAIH